MKKGNHLTTEADISVGVFSFSYNFFQGFFYKGLLKHEIVWQEGNHFTAEADFSR